MPSQDYVATPGGYRHKSLVHYVETGYVLEKEEGLLSKMSLTGGVAAEYAFTERPFRDQPFVPDNALVPARSTQGLGQGWIVDSGWLNQTGQPITRFKTTWVVPPPPATSSGQLIYLFNGIQSLSPLFILQPVLQWGVSPAGGGENWAIASWYVGGPNQPAMHSTLVPVEPGDKLTGVMELTGQGTTGLNYRCQFEGVAETGLFVLNVPELIWANETLEAYGLMQASDYPAAAKVSMSDIEIDTGGSPAPLQWQPENRITDVGQHVEIVSDSPSDGEVDIFFS